MLIVHVFVHVKADAVDGFIAATRENARNSVREPGIVRFDIISSRTTPHASSWSRSTTPRKTLHATRRPRTTQRGGMQSRG